MPVYRFSPAARRIDDDRFRGKRVRKGSGNAGQGGFLSYNTPVSG
jgi:hypothetical protein